MTGLALDDVVVLELATGVSGPYSGRLLADLGALVIKCEPPGGDPARSERPLVDGESAFQPRTMSDPRSDSRTTRLKTVAPIAVTMTIESAIPRRPRVARAASVDAMSWSGR